MLGLLHSREIECFRENQRRQICSDGCDFFGGIDVNASSNTSRTLFQLIAASKWADARKNLRGLLGLTAIKRLLSQ